MGRSAFSIKLATAIAAAGKRKGKLARAVGVSPLTMSRYLKGTTTPKQEVLQALARELNVSPTWLLSGDSIRAEKHDDEQGSSLVREEAGVYTFSPIALLARLDEEERATVDRLVRALLSGDAQVRQHLIGQLQIIEQALAARRTGASKVEGA